MREFLQVAILGLGPGTLRLLMQGLVLGERSSDGLRIVSRGPR